MKRVQMSDLSEVAYRVVGEEGPYVALVHGWMVSGAVYDDIVAALPGFRLVIPDLRGAGHSGQVASGYSIARYAEDVIAVMDDVGANTFGLVGHSMGGQVAQWIAATQPSRVVALALLNTVPAAGIPFPEEAVGLFRHSGGQRESQATILGMACKLLSEETKERLLDDAAKISAACIQEGFDAWSKGGFADKLAAITAPTFVLATDDPFLPADFLTEAVVKPIAGARLGYLPGPGHYPQVEKAPETAALLNAFFAGISW